MSKDSILKKLRAECEKIGAELVECGNNGHFQIKGKLLVNYYPFSKKLTAYVAGTTTGKKSCTPAEAVLMSKTQPMLAKKGVRTDGARAKRAAMIKKGITTCYWCGMKLTLNTSTIEHIIPLSTGGLENANNRTLACKDCNEARGNTMPELEASE